MQPTLLEVHGRLAELSYAVKLMLEGISCRADVRWDASTYLRVEVECRGKDVQKVVDRLHVGAIAGPYDFRFSSLSYQTGAKDLDYVIVSAWPNMTHDHDKLRKAS